MSEATSFLLSGCLFMSVPYFLALRRRIDTADTRIFQDMKNNPGNGEGNKPPRGVSSRRGNDVARRFIMVIQAGIYIRGAALALALLGVAACGAQAAVPTHVAQTAKGATLVDAKGMTLYVFAKDADGKSACNGPCATNWPPLMVAAGAMTSDGYTIVTRDDGGKQWAYKGKPLYTWMKDHKPGDITGDGFLNGAWLVAQP